MPFRSVLLVVTVALFLGGAVFFSIRMLAIVGAMRQARPTERLDRLPERLMSVLVHVFAHRRMLRNRLSGVLHLFIFSGFVVLLADIVQTLIEPYGGSIGPVLAFLVDVWVVVVLVGIVLALYNRMVLRPQRFHGSDERDAYFILALIAVIVVGIAIHESFFPFVARTVLHVPDGLVQSQFLGLALSGLWSALGWTTPAAANAGYLVGYVMDIGGVFFFLGYLPYSKHFHVFLAVPSIFVRELRPNSEIAAEVPESGLAVRSFTDLSWKDMLDLFTCTECGRCQDVCPAYASGAPLSPKMVVLKLRDALNDRIREHGPLDAPMPAGVVSADELWACTTCSACQEACPVFIEHVPKIVGLRAALVEDGEAPKAVEKTLVAFGRHSNSFGRPARRRHDWIKGLDVHIKDARTEPVDWLWFVGDFASFDPRAQQVSRLVAQMLAKAGVDFGILFDDEVNSGNDALRMGEFGLFQELAEKNLQALEGATYNRIFTTDPHSLNALRHEYHRFGFDRPVVHYTEALLELVREGRLQPKPLGRRATYHDPCYLGRWNRVFDAPRDLIRSCGVEVVEMPRNREQSFCCGAGGGRIWMDEESGRERPGDLRIREALSLDVPYFVVACPKDVVMFSASVVSAGGAERMQVVDVADLLAEACGVGEPAPAAADA